MPDMTVSCTVTRDELALADLELNASPYTLWRDGIGPGSRTRRRHSVESPFVDGAVIVHSVRAMAELRVKIKVKAASDSALWTAVDALVAAFEQRTYDILLTADGQTRSWRCYAADWSPGESGAIESLRLREHWQTLTFDCPRDPVPLVGNL